MDGSLLLPCLLPGTPLGLGLISRGFLGPLWGWVCSLKPGSSDVDASEGLQLERLGNKGYVLATQSHLDKCWGRGGQLDKEAQRALA